MKPHIKKLVLAQQLAEITEHFIYADLAAIEKDPHNQKVLTQISKDELAHYDLLKKYTETEIKPDRFRIFRYKLIARIFGLTFGLKLMERGEGDAQDIYNHIAEELPEVSKIVADEERHELELLDTLNEKKLKYVGSVVLGLNDALIELLGVLAGLTFAFQSGEIVAIAGLITGIAAALSMGASEYLSTKNEETTQSPITASLYTMLAYLFTVIILITPFFILTNKFHSLGMAVISALIIIAAFNFYISVAQNKNFKKRFFEMASLSLGVALISFLIGIAVRTWLGIDI